MQSWEKAYRSGRGNEKTINDSMTKSECEKAKYTGLQIRLRKTKGILWHSYLAKFLHIITEFFEARFDVEEIPLHEILQ